MNIAITTFINPFSFFCKLENQERELRLSENQNNIIPIAKSEVSDFNHGQYIAVMWKNKWVRGVVTMESTFLIWLIDYGIYIRPDVNTVYVNLPNEHKKYPTKIFEASVHGVSPVDKILTEDCQIRNETSSTWNKGTTEKAQALISSASSIYFVPVALLSTHHNDVVLGDLYLCLSNKQIVNFVDELEMWPVFLEKNQKQYIDNLSLHYISRRKHRACTLKPEFPDFELPLLTLNTSLDEYSAICANIPHFQTNKECTSDYEDGSTVVGNVKKEQNVYKLTPAEMEKYSRMYVMVGNQQFNVLNVLTNKIRDLNMCERYKNHDLKSVGRANIRVPPPYEM